MQQKRFYSLLIILVSSLLAIIKPQLTLAAISNCQATEMCQGMGLDPNTICNPITDEMACKANTCCRWLGLPAILVNNVTQPTTETNQEQEPSGPTLIIPELQIKLPGLVFSDQNKIQTTTDEDQTLFYIPWIGEYIKWLYNYSIGIIGLLALLAIMIGGFYWIMAGGSASRVSEAKSWINAAISGLGLALVSYLILVTINSNLVKLPALKVGYIKTKNLDFINEDIYRQITGNSSSDFKMDSETLQAMKNFALENDIEPCILYAIIGNESGGKLNAIGHDEEISYTGSYKRFIADKVTYKGKQFSNTTKPINDDKDCTNKFKKGVGECNIATLSLDWRYSHGIGLAQATPNPKEGTLATACDGIRNGSGSDYGYLFSDGTCISLRNLITYQGAFQFLAKSWKTFYCRNNRTLLDCFKVYAGGEGALKVENKAANTNANKKMSSYNYCIQNKSSLFPSGGGGSF